MAKESRQGKIPEGWIKQGVQIPKHLRERLEVEANEKGVSSIKLLGTTAFCVILGMPAEIRDDLYALVSRMSWKGPENIDEDQVWRELSVLVQRSVNSEKRSKGTAAEKTVDESKS